MQTEVLDEHGSDCGTKKTIDVKLTNRNRNDFEYRYIVEGDKLVELTPQVMDKYIGKTIHMRSPMYCLGDKTCNICAGEMNYKLGNKNVGLGCSKVANTLLNLGMKKFHTSNLKSSQINPDEMLI
jgi:hypothetical protein